MSDAIQRRMSVVSDNPESLLDEGISALHHPDVPHQIKFAAAPVLFAAKHFGTKGLTPPDHLFEVNKDKGDPHGAS